MSQIRPLIPLLVTAGILIGGNGLQGTYMSLRGPFDFYLVWPRYRKSQALETVIAWIMAEAAQR